MYVTSTNMIKNRTHDTRHLLATHNRRTHIIRNSLLFFVQSV